MQVLMFFSLSEIMQANVKTGELYFYLRVTEQHSQLQTTGFTIYKCGYLQYKMYKLYSVKALLVALF